MEVTGRGRGWKVHNPKPKVQGNSKSQFETGAFSPRKAFPRARPGFGEIPVLENHSAAA
jgi:hypothetical protein